MENLQRQCKNNTTMRKLKLQVQMTIDGYIVGPNSEMDLRGSEWDDKLKNYVGEITELLIELSRKKTC